MIRKYGWIAALALAADRVSKALVPRIPAEGAALIPGIVGLRSVRNTGMAFSLFSGRPWLLGLLSLGIVAGAFFFLRGKKLRPVISVGLMLMLGGAAGNLIDRFALGYVPDMIELLFVDFAVFNVADMCLVIGCLTVMAGILRSGETDGFSDQETEERKREAKTGPVTEPEADEVSVGKTEERNGGSDL